MHAAAIDLRGGVSPRGTLLRGQSIIEYVLIIAIIGLLIVFAGPSVAGAIRNQFNQVTNTVNSGTDGDGFLSAEEKAYQEAMKNITSKDAKDWTLDEQEAAATDIAKNGTSSVAYAKAKAAMDAGTKWSVKLTDGKTLEYRIIGIDHDDLADGSGKAGLTFLNTPPRGRARMNATDTSDGGWEKSELRQKMNSGKIWNLMPSDFQSKVKPVRKLTNNVSGTDKNATVSATSDRLFLLSYSEIFPNSDWISGFPWLYSEGTQYEAFKDKVTENNSDNSAIDYGRNWWLRSPCPYGPGYFVCVRRGDGVACASLATNSQYVCLAWCF